MWIRERRAATPDAPEGPDGRRLRAWVDKLARPRHFWAEASENRRIGDLIATELGRLGWDVTLQGRYRNVVAVPARHDSRPLVFVCAHYDSVPDCPGADDNASGVAVMLECARALAGRETSSPVGFIAFNAEEDGLLGSRDFVTSGSRQLRRDIAAVHVLEMCGFRAFGSGSQRSPLPFVTRRLTEGSFIAVVGQGVSNDIAEAAIRSPLPSPHRVALKMWRGAHRIVADLARSDHAPFWETGIPAVLWTDTGSFRNPHYHRASDTPETLDYAFMDHVRELLMSVVVAGTVT